MEHVSNRKLFFFSLPLIGSLLTQQLYSAVSMIIVGQTLGANELAAIGNASNLLMLFIVISGGIELAVEIIFSRFIGKQQFKKLSQSIGNILVLAILAGLILTVIGMLLLPAALTWMQVPENLMADTLTYSRIYLLGVPCIYLYDISRAMLLTFGEARKSFLLVLSSSLLNILLNLIFILVFNWGIAGAALGTVFAQAALMVVSLLSLHKKAQSFPDFSLKIRMSWQLLKELAHIALPSMFQQFVITFASVLLQALVNPLGNDIIIGYVAITRVLNISRIVISGFSQTLSIYSARAFAAEASAALKQFYRFLVKISVIYGVIVSLLLVIFARTLCNLFFDSSSHPAAYNFFFSYLLFSSLITLLTVFKFMNESLLRSSLSMRNYLICNVGDLVIRIAATSLLIPLVGAHAFWLGELIGRSFSFLASFGFIKGLKQRLQQAWLPNNNKKVLS
ncbi:MATE family efflux transporter [Enterococcus sp. LJL90]